jgi:ribosomal protein S18 acetylase RimI-like enzyme
MSERADESELKIVAVTSQSQLEAVRDLFREYAKAIDIDLCFQNFAEELAGLPDKYAPPTGRLLLAFEGGQAAGCVAVRPIAKGICEMKRLYVRPAFRGKGIGRRLAQAALAGAGEIGYHRMRLDTLASMKEAIALYESLGFMRIAPYYHNPSPQAVFMERPLR